MINLNLYAVHIVFGGKGMIVLATTSQGAVDSVRKRYNLKHVWSVREIPGPYEEGSILFNFSSTVKE